jgi:dTDP-4-amino-4,6-dideoxygalactose transaminase
MYELKNFGIHGPEEVSAVGANAKMNEFCAAMGICNLRHMDEIVLQRKAIVERYRERLSDVKGLQLNVIQDDVESNYAYFPIVIDEKSFGSSREEVMQYLGMHNVRVRKYFYALTSSFKAFHRKYDVLKTPVALHISKRILTLPIYPDLSIEDVDRICDLVLQCKSVY